MKRASLHIHNDFQATSLNLVILRLSAARNTARQEIRARAGGCAASSPLCLGSAAASTQYTGVSRWRLQGCKTARDNPAPTMPRRHDMTSVLSPQRLSFYIQDSARPPHKTYNTQQHGSYVPKCESLPPTTYHLQSTHLRSYSYCQSIPPFRASNHVSVQQAVYH